MEAKEGEKEMKKQPATFATRLRQLRTEAGLSQSELAKRSGIPQPNISGMENGIRAPTWVTACRIADALGVSVDRLR